VCLCSEDQCVSSPDVGELSPEGPQPPLILLQQLLSASTQPSPIKAIFHRQELEVRDHIYTSLTFVLNACEITCFDILRFFNIICILLSLYNIFIQQGCIQLIKSDSSIFFLIYFSLTLTVSFLNVTLQLQ